MVSPYSRIRRVASVALLLLGSIAPMHRHCAANDGADEPPTSAGPLDLGCDYLERGETQRAIEQLDAAVRLPDRQATAYSYRAIARLKKDNLKGAVADVEAAVAIAETNSKGRPRSAATQLEVAFAHFTKDAVLRWVWHDETGVFVMRGSLSLASGPSELELAIDACEHGLEIEPENVKLLLLRAFAYRKEGNSTRAIADCNKVIQLEPRNTRAYVTRAYARIDENMYDQAIADCNKAITFSSKDAEAYLLRGRIHLHKRDLKKAFADLEQAARIQPSCASGTDLMTVFVCNFERDRLTEAIAGLDRVCAIRPTDPEFLLMRAYAHLRNLDPEKAAADYEKARKLGVHPSSLWWLHVIGEGIAVSREE